MQNLCSKIKAATLRVTDNSLKKSCSKITLIRISKRTSKLLRLKML